MIKAIKASEHGVVTIDDLSEPGEVLQPLQEVMDRMNETIGICGGRMRYLRTKVEELKDGDD